MTPPRLTVMLLLGALIIACSDAVEEPVTGPAPTRRTTRRRPERRPQRADPPPARRPADDDPVMSRLVGQDPSQYQNPLHTARQLLNDGRHADALIAAEKVLASTPDSGTAHFIVGRCHEAAERVEPAIAAYTRALAHDPSDLRPLARRGVLLFNQRQFERALPDLEQFVARTDDAGQRKTVADVVAQIKAHLEGRRHGEIMGALTKDAKALRNQLHQAAVLLRTGRTGDALTLLDSMLRDDATNLEARLMRGLARHGQKQYAQAITDYDRAVSGAPTDPRAYSLRAQSRIRRREFRAALADLELYLQYEKDATQRAKFERQVAQLRKIVNP